MIRRLMTPKFNLIGVSDSVDYSIFYRYLIEPSHPISKKTYDVFISGYNKSDRVRCVFDRVRARRKIWVVHHEYGYDKSDFPASGEVYLSESSDEAMFWRELIDDLQVDSKPEHLCVDITGLVAPYMMYLVAVLSRIGVTCFDCLYSEPISYVDREDTVFSKGHIREVRAVAGFSGIVEQDTSGDLLIIGAGYEDQLIAEVAQHKDAARKAVIFGFPSLRVDMYQQNVLRASGADESLGPVPHRWRFFAPANDPFVTASVLREIVKGGAGIERVTNLYLSPLATRAQALGFVIFFLYERKRIENINMIFPFCTEYERLTDVGLSRTWRYELELAADAG